MQPQADTLNYHFGLDTESAPGGMASSSHVPNTESIYGTGVRTDLSSTKSAPLIKIPNSYVPPRKAVVVAQRVTVDEPQKFSGSSSRAAGVNAPARPAPNYAQHASPGVKAGGIAGATSAVTVRANPNVDNTATLFKLVKIAGAVLILAFLSVPGFALVSNAKSYMPDAMKSAGDVAVALGARSIALNIFDHQLTDPKYVTVLVEWGNNCRARGRNEDALVYLNRAVAINPEYPLAYLNRGAVYLDLGQPQKAIADDTRAIGLNSDYAMAFNNRACSYMNVGKLGLAIADFSKAIEHEPGTMRYWLNRGNCYLQMKQYKQAIQNYDYAIAHGNAQAVSLKQQAQSVMKAPHAAGHVVHVKKHQGHKSIVSR